jgi:hypothetical protein
VKAVVAHAAAVAEGFFEGFAGSPGEGVERFVVRPARLAAPTVREPLRRWIRSDIRERCGVLELDAEGLCGVSAVALQGALEFSMVLLCLERERAATAFNFQRRILPLMAVAGSAAQLMRELVEDLRAALQAYRATGALLAAGRGEGQVRFRRDPLLAAGVPPEPCAAMADHDWIRALHLCRKAREYGPLALLAASGLPGAEDLAASWRERNEVPAADARLLAGLGEELDATAGAAFDHRMMALFLRVRESLLVKGAALAAPAVIH